MSAQPGNSIGLNYRPQPAAAEQGDDIWLEYTLTGLRRIGTRVVAPWVLANPSISRVRALRPDTTLRDIPRSVPWRVADPLPVRAVLPWGVADTADRAVRANWGTFDRKADPRSIFPWGVASTADCDGRLPWGRYTRTPARSERPGWGITQARDTAATLPWGVCATLDQRLAARHGRAVRAYAVHELPWVRYSRIVDPGWGVVTPPNEPPTDENGTILVPKLRSYIVVNNASLMRVSNSLAIEALTLEVRGDADDVHWAWSASLFAKQLDDLEPDTPGELVELEAQINGVVWRLLVEDIARDRRFAQDRINIGGRGIAANIADPNYERESRDNTAGALTAQQVAAAALTDNGVSIGWSLAWSAPDWLIPAGAWVHTGTPLEAVRRIADAGGGYVRADPIIKTLHVLPRYPTLPWEFAAATPDYVLPAEATTRMATRYIRRPPHNVVWIQGGEVGGILAQVKRTGSAADRAAEAVVDPLVTHVDAARGRGEAILGNTGPQQLITVETPILDEVGLIPIGALVEWQEGATALRGIVRSARASFARPRARQTLEIECHE